MESILAPLKALKLWQVLAVVIVFVGTTGGVYAAYTFATDTDNGGLEENQQLVPVQLGNLVNDISISGSLVYSDRETLRFGRQGTVEEVFVEEGQIVDVGEPLARLDSETIADLEKSVAQSRITVREAEDALATALTPDAQALARAESDVANARLTLSNAEDALSELLVPTALAVAQAESTVAKAEDSLLKAQDTLSEYLNPSPLSIAQSESKLATAEISLENAQEIYDIAAAGPTAQDVSDAQTAVDSASATLDAAISDQAVAQRDRTENVSNAEEQLATAQVDYLGIFGHWLGIGDGLVLALPPSEQLQALGVDLETVFDPASYTVFFRDAITDDPATPWNELVVYTWLNLYPAEISVSCDDGTLSQGELCVTREIDTSWDSLQTALTDLDVTRSQSAKAISNAEDAAIAKRKSLETRQEELVTALAGPDALDVENKQTSLDVARAAFDEAEEALENLLTADDRVQLAVLQREVALAQSSLDKAREDLTELLGDPNPLELAVKDAQVDVANATLHSALEDLIALQSGDDLDVTLKRADLAAAQATLEAAEETLAKTTIRAPWAGIVSTVNVEEGDQVNGVAAAFEMVNPTVVEVDGAIDEIDVLFLRQGASAAVTLEALPDQTLTGVVSEIAASAFSQQGVVTYPIKIRIEVPDGTLLPEGLTAVASVVIREENDVLLVPLQTIGGTFQEPVVRIWNDGEIELRTVDLGTSDDFWTIVTGGLSEGEQVVMDSVGSTQNAFGGAGAIFRLGAGGGGRGGPR